MAKFELSIEIKKVFGDYNWLVSYSIGPINVYDSRFFIEGYPISNDTEINEGTEGNKFQRFTFNKQLHKEIQELLFPGSKHNYINVSKREAWEYYHYLSYEGFTFNVHPISMSDKFMRQRFIGTQEEIYKKCFELNKKWIKK